MRDPAAITTILGRRGFLHGAALLLAACGAREGEAPPPSPSPDAPTPPTPAPGPELAPGTAEVFRVLAEMREVSRRSPDHLAFEADRVVATKDPAAIFAFVRDRFVTLPASVASLGPDDRQLWGTRGTLRCGAGTLRDKAELLVALFARAGFAAKVVAGRPANADGLVRRALFHQPDRTFAASVDPATAARWRRVLDAAAPPAPQGIDADGALAEAVASRLLAALPAGTSAAKAFSFEAPTYVPLVAVTVDGKTIHANVVEPGIAFGETGTVAPPGPASGLRRLPKVRLSISVVTTAAPKTPIELVAAEHATEDLVGRALRVAMVPPESIRELASRRLADVRTFLPVLAVQAPELDEAERAKLVHAGDAITLAGEVVARDADGNVSVAGAPLYTSPFDPARLARVATLVVRPSAARFPGVELRVAALDASGKSVDGLPASAFRVAEGGALRTFTLLENRSRPPRILFILDRSRSLPPEFLDGRAAALLRDLAAELKAAIPGATFRVLTVGGLAEDGEWTADPAVIHLAATRQTGFGSDHYRALAEAGEVSATTCVFVTDGRPEGPPSAETLAGIARVAPSVFLGVGTVDDVSITRLAGLVGGKVFPVAAHAEASAAVKEFVLARQTSVYLLRYAADLAGPSTRAIALGLATPGPAASATYEVPAPEAIAPPTRIGGVLLTIRVGTDAPIVRVLAGQREVPLDAPPAYFEAVEAAFLGAVEVRFEGAPPTTAAVVDEALTGALGWAPVAAALEKEDAGAILDALLQVPGAASAEGLALHAPLIQPADARVFPTGLRAVVFAAQPRSAREVTRKIDITPLGPYAAAADGDARAAFVATVRATARLACLERALFTTSTGSLLEGVALAGFGPAEPWTRIYPAMPAERRRTFELASASLRGHKVVPLDGGPVAFWDIDAETGHVLGILDDGGGAGRSIDAFARDMNRFLDLYARLAGLVSLAGCLGVTGGIWLQLEIDKAKKLLGAMVVIFGEGAPASDPSDWREVARNVVCGWALGQVGGFASSASASVNRWLRALGRRSEDLLTVNTVTGIVTGTSAFCAVVGRANGE